MQVMTEVTNPLAREKTMTAKQGKAELIAIKELVEREEDFSVRRFTRGAGLCRRHGSCSAGRTAMS